LRLSIFINLSFNSSSPTSVIPLQLFIIRSLLPKFLQNKTKLAQLRMRFFLSLQFSYVNSKLFSFKKTQNFLYTSLLFTLSFPFEKSSLFKSSSSPTQNTNLPIKTQLKIFQGFHLFKPFTNLLQPNIRNLLTSSKITSPWPNYLTFQNSKQDSSKAWISSMLLSNLPDLYLQYLFPFIIMTFSPTKSYRKKDRSSSLRPSSFFMASFRLLTPLPVMPLHLKISFIRPRIWRVLIEH